MALTGVLLILPLSTRLREAFIGQGIVGLHKVFTSQGSNRGTWFAKGCVDSMPRKLAPLAQRASVGSPLTKRQSAWRRMTFKNWIRYLTSIHGISGVISILGGSIWTTVRLATGSRKASYAEVVVNVVLSALILATGCMRLRKIRNEDLVLKFWVGVSIQFFALFQILEAPLLGWIPYSIFGNWISRIWGILSVCFFIKWVIQIKKWNEAFETKSDKMVARIFHPLMAPAMGSVVVMEVVTFLNFVELHFDMVSQCSAAKWLFMDSQLVSLAVNNVAQFTLTLANQNKVSTIEPLFYILGVIGAVQFGLLMWVHLARFGFAGLNAFTLIPLMCRAI